METMSLVDALPGEMSAELPMLHMEPAMDFKPDPADYDAPLYKTALRAGVLSTTGKFLCQLDLPQSEFTKYSKFWYSLSFKQALVFTCLQYKSFGNTVGKGEIAHNEQFLLLP